MADEKKTTETKETKETKPEPPPEKSSTTEHSINIEGRPVRYSATAATTHVKADDGTVRASVFTVSYTRSGVRDRASRPLTFCFNGGPGSSSIWLHMGALGPKRIPIGETQTPPIPPYRLIDNAHSILDISDLIFIDPVSTGWSRPVEKDKGKEFHGLTEDTESVGDLIRLLTSKAGRWSSPKYLAGESYGTTRAASLSGYLQERHGMYLNGISLISAVLLFQTLIPARGNDILYALYLPSYAATAWHHKRLEAKRSSLKALTDEVEKFALEQYGPFLMREARSSAAERKRIKEKLSAYTGLSERFLESANLRVAPQRFFKELLRDGKRTVGRFDSRFMGIDPDSAGETMTYDPSYALVLGPYVAALNSYIKDDLKFDYDLTYEALAGEAVRPWKWGEAGENKFVDVASTLARAMSFNRHLKVFLGSGYYDLATPFMAAEWTFEQMQLEPDQLKNVTMKRYEAGHMMYVHEPSMRKLREDMGAFYTASGPTSKKRK